MVTFDGRRACLVIFPKPLDMGLDRVLSRTLAAKLTTGPGVMLGAIGVEMRVRVLNSAPPGVLQW